MRMLNAKGGGGASGWWGRRSSRIGVEDTTTVSPLVPVANDAKINAPDISSSSDEDDEEPQHLVERSYAPGEEFFLTDYQKGKLPGLDTLDSAADRRWAAAGIEAGNTIRRFVDSCFPSNLIRHQNDGPRFDSEALSGKKPTILKVRERTERLID